MGRVLEKGLELKGDRIGKLVEIRNNRSYNMFHQTIETEPESSPRATGRRSLDYSQSDAYRPLAEQMSKAGVQPQNTWH